PGFPGPPPLGGPPAAGVVEARTGQPGPGDGGLVGAAAARVGGVEPLGEELAEPVFAGGALVGQPVTEAGFELGFGDVAAAVVALDLLQGLGEPGGTE